MKAIAFRMQHVCTRLLRTVVLGIGVGALSLFGTLTAMAQSYTILRVNQSAPANSLNDGSSWANAFTNLQSAIAAAQPTAAQPVEIWIARGTYYPTNGT